MDFGYASSQQALRQEVRDFIAENMTQDVVEEVHGRGEDGRGPLMNDLFKKIGERGWLGISWPKEYGGQGGDLSLIHI